MADLNRSDTFAVGCILATMHSVEDRQTDRQTDDSMMPIADHDRLKILQYFTQEPMIVLVLRFLVLHFSPSDNFGKYWSSISAGPPCTR